MGNAIEVFLLTYEYDIVLVGDTVPELQRKISWRYFAKSGVWK